MVKAELRTLCGCKMIVEDAIFGIWIVVPIGLPDPMSLAKPDDDYAPYLNRKFRLTHKKNEEGFPIYQEEMTNTHLILIAELERVSRLICEMGPHLAITHELKRLREKELEYLQDR